MNVLRSVAAASATALLAIGLAPAATAQTANTSNMCEISGPDVVNIYKQAMNFSVTVTPAPGMDRSIMQTHVHLGTGDGTLKQTTLVDHPTSDKAWFTFDPASGAHYQLVYGNMYEGVHELGLGQCGDGVRTLTVKSATRPYVSAVRSGSYVKVNGTIEHYDKDWTVNSRDYGQWVRIKGTYLDFQRYEGGQWVTKKSVLTDAYGNANTGWMSYPTTSSWRVQYRGGWWLQATATGAVAR